MYFFGLFGRLGMVLYLGNEVLSIQKVKYIFVHLLWLETKLFFCGWSYDVGAIH